MTDTQWVVGSDLDAEVAMRVFGQQVHWDNGIPKLGPKPHIGYSTVKVPHYSGQPSHIQDFIELWRADNLNFVMGYDSGHDGTLGRDYGPAGYFCRVDDDYDATHAEVQGCVTLPLAVCLASLQVVSDD